MYRGTYKEYAIHTLKLEYKKSKNARESPQLKACAACCGIKRRKWHGKNVENFISRDISNNESFTVIRTPIRPPRASNIQYFIYYFLHVLCVFCLANALCYCWRVGGKQSESQTSSVASDNKIKIKSENSAKKKVWYL